MSENEKDPAKMGVLTPAMEGVEVISKEEIEKILNARRFYNGAVKQFATRLQSFPDLIVARLFAFRAPAFFETDDRAAVEVKL